MNAMLQPIRYSPEDLSRIPNGNWYELVDGVLQEKHVSQLASWVAGEILTTLRLHTRMTHQGEVFTSDASYQCFPDRPRTLRKPDVSFVRRDRLPKRGPGAGNFLIAPDLAVEVISPNDEYEAVDAKISDYLSVKVPLIWIVCPNTRTVTIHRLDGSATRLQGDQEITGESVLPGFVSKISAFYYPLPSSTDADPENQPPV